MKKSIRERIRTAKSTEEIERILSIDLRHARPSTERRIQRAAKKRMEELK